MRRRGEEGLNELRIAAAAVYFALVENVRYLNASWKYEKKREAKMAVFYMLLLVLSIFRVGSLLLGK